MRDQPAKQPVQQYDHEAAHDDRNKVGCTDYSAAHDRTERDGNDIIQRRTHAERASARYTDQDKRDEKHDNAPAAHLQCVKVLTFSENFDQQFHNILV